jgi:hypothetical protein
MFGSIRRDDVMHTTQQHIAKLQCRPLVTRIVAVMIFNLHLFWVMVSITIILAFASQGRWNTNDLSPVAKSSDLVVQQLQDYR